MPLWSVSPHAVAAAGTGVDVVTRYGRSGVQFTTEHGLLFAAPERPNHWRVYGWFLNTTDADARDLALQVLIVTADTITPDDLTLTPNDPLVNKAISAYHGKHLRAPVTVHNGPETVLAALELAFERLWLQHITRPLTDRIPGLTITDIAGVQPMIIHGTWHEWAFSFRYRHGVATLDVGQRDIPDAYWTASHEHGDDFDGYLSWNELPDVFCQTAELLAQAPYLYHFEDKSHPAPSVSKRTEYPHARYAYGHSPADAYDTIKNTKIGRIPNAVSPIPLNTDPRTFPPVMPPFTVLLSEPGPDTNSNTLEGPAT